MLEQKPAKTSQLRDAASEQRGTLYDQSELNHLKSEAAHWEEKSLKRSIERVPESKTEIYTPAASPSEHY